MSHRLQMPSNHILLGAYMKTAIIPILEIGRRRLRGLSDSQRALKNTTADGPLHCLPAQSPLQALRELVTFLVQQAHVQAQALLSGPGFLTAPGEAPPEFYGSEEERGSELTFFNRLGNGFP